MTKTPQKFRQGERVAFDDPWLGKGTATVVGSYADQYPWGTDEHQKHIYTLDTDHRGKVSWFYEHNLTRLPEAYFTRQEGGAVFLKGE